MSDDLAELLATGERAAFHGRPASGVVALESAFERARTDGKGAEATAAAWLLGVCLAAAGKFGGSLAVLEPLVAAGTSEVPERRLFAALAASTLGGRPSPAGPAGRRPSVSTTPPSPTATALPRRPSTPRSGLAADAVIGR